MNIKSFWDDQNNIKKYNNLDNYLLGGDIVLIILLNREQFEIDKLYPFVFLSWKEVFNEVALDPIFFPSNGKYELYSESLYRFIHISSEKKYTRIQYMTEPTLISITDLGKSKIKKKMSTIEADFELLNERLDFWDTKKNDIGIYIRENYPEYVLNYRLKINESDKLGDHDEETGDHDEETGDHDEDESYNALDFISSDEADEDKIRRNQNKDDWYTYNTSNENEDGSNSNANY